MRRELISVFVAMSTMIVIGFLIPLGLAARSSAHDRALDTARAESAALIPFLATDNPEAVQAEIERANSGDGLVVTVIMPDRNELGAPVPVQARERLDRVLNEATSLAGPVAGGQELVSAVALPNGQRGAVRVLVPDRELNRGVRPAWAILIGLGATLVLLAVVMADRIAQRIIQPTERLAAAAASLGRGEFDVTVEPDGPAELATTAIAFNTLAGRVRSMLNDEREMVSELTHRLRTPLTRLRIDLDRVDDEVVAARLHASVDAFTAEVNDLITQARHSVDPPTSIDVAAVVAERFQFWSVLAVDEGRECRLDSGGEVPMSIDADELEAALDVLIENVFAHTPAGTAFILSVQPTPDGCCITVDDAGPGFNPDLAGPGQSGAGSTGLGLSIVGRLAAKSNGTVAITTSELGGARVECRIKS